VTDELFFESMGLILVVVLAAAINFVPTIIAAMRRYRLREIFIWNLVLTALTLADLALVAMLPHLESGYGHSRLIFPVGLAWFWLLFSACGAASRRPSTASSRGRRCHDPTQGRAAGVGGHLWRLRLIRLVGHRASHQL
jgi:hypothetical protein